MKKRLVILGSVFCVILAIYGIIIINKDKACVKNDVLKEEKTYIYEPIRHIEKEIVEGKIKKLKSLQNENSDIVALIQIEGTNINYPVLQREDNSYYLKYNYKKERSDDGALILDKSVDLSKPSTNILIYGHNNIGSNEMFASLIKYKNKSFYEKHKTIIFTTTTEESTYEIISVFLSKVYLKTQTNVFKYYFFIDAKNEEEFNKYILNCKRLSIYEIEATAKYGDELMTLSTCEYSRINGRFVVVARKIK